MGHVDRLVQQRNRVVGSVRQQLQRNEDSGNTVQIRHPGIRRAIPNDQDNVQLVIQQACYHQLCLDLTSDLECSHFGRPNLVAKLHR